MTNTGAVSSLRKAHELAISRNYTKAIAIYRQLADSNPDLLDISNAMIDACTAICRRQYLGEDLHLRSSLIPSEPGAAPTQPRPLHPLGHSHKVVATPEQLASIDDILAGKDSETQLKHESHHSIRIDPDPIAATDAPIRNAEIPHAESQLGMAIDIAELNADLGTLRISGWLIDPEQSLKWISIGLPSGLGSGKAPTIRRRHREDLRGLVHSLGISEQNCDRILATAGYEITLFVNPQPQSTQPAIEGVAAMRIGVTLESNAGKISLGKQLSEHSDAVEAAKQLIDQLIGGNMEVLDPESITELSERWAARTARLLAEPAQHRRHGLLDRTPDLSVVVPLYGRIDFMEYQLNWFNSWYRRLGDQNIAIQLIYVLDDPRLQQAFKDLTKRCSMLYRMPFEVVINPQNLGFAGAINAGSAKAEAEWLLLLNSDVIPAADDSFEKMLRAIQQHDKKIGALGARLLFENGDIQHLGMEFEKRPGLDGVLGHVWLNDHPMKGLSIPMDPEQIQPLVEVEAATAACLLLRTERFKALNGLSNQYIVGDFEDSDLCMKLREQGLGIYVDPSASFYHLERQSVGSGDQRQQLKIKLVAANAITHHRLWNRAIEDLKAVAAKP